MINEIINNWRNWHGNLPDPRLRQLKGARFSTVYGKKVKSTDDDDVYNTDVPEQWSKDYNTDEAELFNDKILPQLTRLEGKMFVIKYQQIHIKSDLDSLLICQRFFKGNFTFLLNETIKKYKINIEKNELYSWLNQVAEIIMEEMKKDLLKKWETETMVRPIEPKSINQKVITELNKHTSIRVKNLASNLGLPSEQVNHAVIVLLRAGKIRRLGLGVYAPITT